MERSSAERGMGQGMEKGRPLMREMKKNQGMVSVTAKPKELVTE